MKPKAFKLGIAGTHSTGKSTLLEAIKVHLEESKLKVGRVSDLASEAKDLGFPILREHTFESTAWIMSRGITLELQAERESDVVLVDRPIPDALGYLIAALRSRGAALDDAEDGYLRTLVKIHTPTYHMLLVTEADPGMAIDATKPRDHDQAFRQMAEVGIRDAFASASVSPRVVRFADRDEVIEMTVQTIRARASRL